MIKTYLINLNNSTARLERMQVEFSSRSLLDFCRISAVNAYAPDVGDIHFLDRVSSRGPWGPLDGHARGCTASHLKAYQTFLSTNEEFAAIFEDDVFLAKDVSTWLENDYWIPADADVVKLERWRDDRLLVVISREGFDINDRTISRLYSKHSGAAGYIIRRRAAERALDNVAVNVPIDHLLFHPNVSKFSRSLKIYQVSPALCQQGNEPVKPSYHKDSQPRRKITVKVLRGIAELKSVYLFGLMLLLGRSRLGRVKFS
jgi:glycosyl transferase family 25